MSAVIHTSFAEAITELSTSTLLRHKSKFSLLIGSYSEQNFNAEISMLTEQIDFQNITVLSSSRQLNTLAETLKSAEVLVAMGGGKVLDLAKYLAKTLAKELVLIPSNLANDGIYSPVSVIDGQSQAAKVADLLIISTDLMLSLDYRYIQAGIGDLLANYSALQDWLIAVASTKVDFNVQAFNLAKDSLFNFIKEYQTLNPARVSIKEINKPELIKILAKALIVSGKAMQIAGNSRPCSGAEHMISHALDKHYGFNQISSHGLQVAYATYFLEQYRVNLDYSKLDAALECTVGLSISELRADFKTLIQESTGSDSADEVVGSFILNKKYPGRNFNKSSESHPGGRAKNSEFNQLGIGTKDINPLVNLYQNLDLPTNLDFKLSENELLMLAPQTRPGRFSVLDLINSNKHLQT
jgi:glycerol dehydrogenase-like iron-containing ADH family enzyme